MARKRSRLHRAVPVVLLPLFAAAAYAQCSNLPIPGKFYEYYVVASTGLCNGNHFTSLGQSPAINDFAQVGFLGQTATDPGNALWVGDGHNNPAVNPINPGEIGSSEIYDAAVQLSSAYPATGITLVSKDSITTTSPATTSIRVWTTSTPDKFRYAGRGGPSQQFGAVFPFPSVNKKGDAAFMALDQSNPSIKYLVLNTAAGVTKKTTVSVSVGEPMIDDNDDVLLYTTAPSLVVYPPSLATPTVIADSTYFTSIDSAPGIARDGSVVAFEGNLNAAGASAIGSNAGPGIFTAIKTSTGTWILARVTGFTLSPSNVPASELGYDESGNAIYFSPSGYAAGTRIGVTHLGLGLSGIPQDSWVISFIGTPSEASRPNPVLKNGMPLFFSAQQGLWTIRVDDKLELGTSTTYGIDVRTAIPVAQVNDTIGGNVLTAIGAYDDIANAATDENSNVRTMRAGDHRVAFWASTANGNQIIVRANHLDSDQDGLLDHWETTGIDMDQDGLVDLDLAAMGANVNARDLFVEMDWITDQSGMSFSFQPAPGVISPAPGTGPNSWLVNMYANAPALNGNEYGVRIDGMAPASIPAGVTLHVDGGEGKDKSGGAFSVNMGTGPLDGGRQIGASGTSSSGLPEVMYFGKPNSLTIPHVNTRAFQDVKDNYFGSLDKDGRELVFHFVVFADYFDAFHDSNGAYSWKVATAGPNTLTSQSALPTLPTDHYSGEAGTGEVVKITSGTGAGQYQTIENLINPTTLQLQGNWTTTPDHTSTFSIFWGNLGVAEEQINSSPDFNSLPGNDAMIALGPLAVPPFTKDNTPAGLLGTPCLQWRDVAHELGHTLGLRHGGDSLNPYQGSNYLSLMSYSWSLDCSTEATVQSYSTTGDPTFDDWANLQFNFSDSMIHLGNSLALGFGNSSEFGEEDPEPSASDYIAINGPTDVTPPVVSVTAPKANSSEGLTLPLRVTVNATDNVQVASVTVSFDVNGNGNTNDPGEVVVAKSSGTNTYTANFAALSGPTGARTITATALDPTGNSAGATVSVNVVNPNPAPSLASLSPSSATHGGAAFTLTVNGSKFVSGAVVEWNGAARATTFVSSAKVTAKIQAADIATAGSATVTVKNPAPGGGTSNGLKFTIQ